ncbi:MAG: phosphotransferase [Candidatus Promineifilaceae bacterium]
MIDSQQFAALARHLIQRPNDGIWNGWHLTRNLKGMNNLLYRAEYEGDVYAVKLTARDERRRAWREWVALRGLEALQMPIAPQAVWFDESLPLPTIVQRWVEGSVSAEARDPIKLATLINRLHNISPGQLGITHQAIISPNTAQALIAHFEEQVAYVPEGLLSAEIKQVRQQVHTLNWPTWPLAQPAFGRADNNPTNFIDIGHQLIAVDWEYSGLIDPAFEIAEMYSTPKMRFADKTHAETFLQAYDHQADDTFLVRFKTYQALMAAWWTARLERARYQNQNGQGKPLYVLPPNWKAENQRLGQHYFQRFQTLCLFL